VGVNERLVYWWRKYVYWIPWKTWRWIGKNFRLYKTSYFERHHHFEELKRKLQSEYERMEKKYGKDFEKNTSPFRVKKVGEKFEYDFVSYDEWEKMMLNLEDENGLDEK
jgi:hypothetical protein